MWTICLECWFGSQSPRLGLGQQDDRITMSYMYSGVPAAIIRMSASFIVMTETLTVMVSKVILGHFITSYKWITLDVFTRIT